MLAVREFQDKPVPPESVRRIVEAGRLSGSSMNRQPWHFIVVRESLRFKVENLETLKQDVALLAKAPTPSGSHPSRPISKPNTTSCSACCRAAATANINCLIRKET